MDAKSLEANVDVDSVDVVPAQAVRSTALVKTLVTFGSQFKYFPGLRVVGELECSGSNQS